MILRRHLPPGLDFSAERARRPQRIVYLKISMRLHRVDYAAVGLFSDLGKPQGYLERAGARLDRALLRVQNGRLSRSGEDPPAWMQEHMPATSTVSLIHNDYKYDNVVLDSSDVTRIIGVLDWEMCTIGDLFSQISALHWPIGWIQQILRNCKQNRWGPTTQPGSLTRAEIVHAYAQETGMRCFPQIAFYVIFARFKLAVILQQIYFRYHQGRTNDERFASMPARIQMLLRASLHAHKRDESSAHLLFQIGGDSKLPSNPNGSRIEAHDPLRNRSMVFRTVHSPLLPRKSLQPSQEVSFQSEQRNACTIRESARHSRRKAHAIQPVIHRQPHTAFDSNSLAHKVAD